MFREHFDACAAAFGSEMGFDLRAEVFDGTGRNLERTDRAQPALFAVEYALAKLAESYGIRPGALAGRVTVSAAIRTYMMHPSCKFKIELYICKL